MPRHAAAAGCALSPPFRRALIESPPPPLFASAAVADAAADTPRRDSATIAAADGQLPYFRRQRYAASYCYYCRR